MGTAKSVKKKQGVYLEAFKQEGFTDAMSLSIIRNVHEYLIASGNLNNFDDVMLRLLDFCRGVLKSNEIGYLSLLIPMQYEFTSLVYRSGLIGSEIVVKINDYLFSVLNSKNL